MFREIPHFTDPSLGQNCFIRVYKDHEQKKWFAESFLKRGIPHSPRLLQI